MNKYPPENCFPGDICYKSWLFIPVVFYNNLVYIALFDFNLFLIGKVYVSLWFQIAT